MKSFEAFGLPEEMIGDCVRWGKQSDHKTPVGAFILDGKRVVSKGFNSTKTSSFQYRIARRVGRPEKVCLHAEIAAIIAARQNISGMAILVLRTRKDGTFARSRPCPVCMLALREAGVLDILYHNGENFVHERLDP